MVEMAGLYRNEKPMNSGKFRVGGSVRRAEKSYRGQQVL